MNQDNAIIPRSTVLEMAATYQTAVEEIRAATLTIMEAQRRLIATFADTYRFNYESLLRHHNCDMANFDSTFAQTYKQEAWKSLVNRMGIRQIMGLEDIKKLDQWLEQPKQLPEITEKNILATMETACANAGQYLMNNAKEVFLYLCPPRRNSQYRPSLKTNNGFALEEKVILENALERWSSNWHVSRWHTDRLQAVDNIFYKLEGKSQPEGQHYGDLIHTITQTPLSTTEGETNYFTFKLFKNGNLHLTFKRSDLVQRLNAMAGELNLKHAS